MVTLLKLDIGASLQRAISDSLVQLESITGYHFNDVTLCESALTHGSRQSKRADYQRLEFLGDRVLSLVIAENLFNRFHMEAEGQLAARLSLLVRGETCAAVGQALGLEDFIIVGVVEKRKGVQRMASVVGDVVESLIGAIYLDGGLEAARAFILRCWAEILNRAPADLKDAKTFVQEWALARALPLPLYEMTGRTGPEHAPVFTITLKVGPYDFATGNGPSKQSAEMAAAGAFILRESLR
jgi:ribonuclease III